MTTVRARDLDPMRWRAPRAPARARLRESRPPMPQPRRIELPGAGPEHVVVDAAGRLLTGIADGRVLRVARDGSAIDEIARIDGRVLGLQVVPDGSLVVCTTRLGLQRIDPERGSVTTLADRVEGEPMTFCSNVVVTRDGVMYFTESSQRYPLEEYRAELLEHSGTGRLMRLDRDGTVTVVLRGLDFANGLRLADDQSHLLIAETGAYRLRRLWLDGERAGSDEVLVDNLPGFPDNLGPGSGGTTWIALASARDPIADRLIAWPGWVRRTAWRLPERMQPRDQPTAWVLQVGSNGRIIRDLQRRGDTYRFVTSACEHDGSLFLGSLVDTAIGVIDL